MTRGARPTSSSRCRRCPYLKAAAVHSADDGTVTLFLLNRSLDQSRSRLASTLRASAASRPSAATTLRNDDLEAINTRDATPVEPATLESVEVTDGGLRVTLPPASWNVVRLIAG